MAQGWSGNVATWGFAKQTAKGAAATNPAIKTKFTGGNIKPNRVLGRFSETAASRDWGASYVSSAGVTGNPAAYLRPDDMASLALYALGANVDSGAGPFVHTANPVDTDVPYITVFKMVAATSGVGAILEKFTDCKVDSLKVMGGSGQPLTYELGIVGITPTFLASNDVVAVTTQTPFIYDQVTVTKAGGAILTCDSFEFTIQNNLKVMMGNGAITPYDIFPGERQVSGSMAILYENTDNYRKFHYGGVAGTAVSRNVLTEALVITATQSASLLIANTFNSVRYNDVPVDPAASGDPIVSQMAWECEPNPGGNICTIATTNSVTTPG